MTDEEKVEQWHHAIDRSISRAMRSEQPFTAETIIDDAGLLLCGETARYLRHVLNAICPSEPIRRDDIIPIEERAECLVKVIFADVDKLPDEARDRALNAQRSLRVIRQLYERMQLRGLLAEETRRFIDGED